MDIQRPWMHVLLHSYYIYLTLIFWIPDTMFTHPQKCVRLQHFCPLWEPTEPSYGPILPQEWILCHSKSDGSPCLLAPLKFIVKCKKKPTVNGFTNSHSKYSQYIQRFWLIFWLNKWLLRWYLKFKTSWKIFC